MECFALLGVAFYPNSLCFCGRSRPGVWSTKTGIPASSPGLAEPLKGTAQCQQSDTTLERVLTGQFLFNSLKTHYSKHSVGTSLGLDLGVSFSLVAPAISTSTWKNSVSGEDSELGHHLHPKGMRSRKEGRKKIYQQKIFFPFLGEGHKK